MTNTNETVPYYSYRRVLSYNGIYNFCVGGRGIGKTYGAIKMAIRDYFKRGEQFIYLRRFEDEITAAKSTFGASLALEFPGKEFRVRGDYYEVVIKETGGEVNPKTGRKSAIHKEWAVIGYFRVLTKAQAQKSTEFPRVTKIIFDEFIIEKGFQRYLPDEHIAFNNFYSTVARRRSNVRVFFLANSVSIGNPYFDEYDIRPDQMKEITGMNHVFDYDLGVKRPFIVVHLIDSERFQEATYKTVFGQFIKGTDYAKYAVENNFSDNHAQLINGKTPSAKYKFTLETAGGTFSVWYDYPIQTFFILSRREKQELLLTMVRENMSDNKKYVKKNDPVLANLRAHFDSARVFFDKQRTRNAFVKVLNR